MTELVVNEIFYSIQGESSRMGCPCVFVRLTYCNLRCTYCDTEYAFYEGKPMAVSQILQEISRYNCDLVEITGGEPLLQEGVHELMGELCNRGFTVLLETGGGVEIGRVDPRVVKILDIKCPGSGMVHKNQWANLSYLASDDEVKFVVKDREDFDWALGIIRKHELDRKCTVLFSPVFGVMEASDLAQWMLDGQIKARFQLQMHKFIWAPETRGV